MAINGAFVKHRRNSVEFTRALLLSVRRGQRCHARGKSRESVGVNRGTKQNQKKKKYIYIDREIKAEKGTAARRLRGRFGARGDSRRR